LLLRDVAACLLKVNMVASVVVEVVTKFAGFACFIKISSMALLDRLAKGIMP